MKARGAHHLSMRVGGAPGPLGRAPYLVGPLLPLRLQLHLHILSFEQKKQREEIIAFYDTEPPPSPKTSREG